MNNQINQTKKNKLTKILGISAGVLFGLAFITLISGVLLCFPDPSTGENISGMRFDTFGECAGIMIVIAVVLIISIVILNVIKPNKRSI